MTIGRSRSGVLCVVGDLLTDVVVRVAGRPTRATDTRASVVHARGGSAANVAVAARRSGAMVRFGGRVGADRRGEELVRRLAEEGIELAVEQVGSTGTVVALVDAVGERSFLTDRGAALDYGGEETTLLEGATWLHLPGYSFAEGALADTSHRLVGEAVELGIDISISTGSLSLLKEYGRSEFQSLIRTMAPTAVIANRPESDFLFSDRSCPDAVWTIVTDGGRATTITHRNGETRSVIPSSTSVLDSTGAGDAFAGAFIAGMMTGVKPVEAVSAGHEMAARTLGVFGADFGEQ